MRYPSRVCVLGYVVLLGGVAACSDAAPSPSEAQSDGGNAASPSADASGSPIVEPGGGDAAAVDSGSIPPGTVPTFVAIGYEGRSIVSCDDGQTWTGDRSDDDSIRCFSPTDCDHDGKAGRGLAFGNGWFVANYGWGQPGTIRRSRDGLTWETVLTGPNFASMMFGDGRFVGAAQTGKSSMDSQVWSDTGSAGAIGGVRRGSFVGNGFLIVGDGPTAAYSTTSQTWSPRTLPSTCGLEMQWDGGIASGNGAIVMVGGNGTACRSVDDGVSWTTTALGARIDSRLLFTGTEFIMWGEGKMFRSSNGQAWMSTPLVQRVGGSVVAGAPNLGPVARSPNGTYVAINGGWQQWYDKQRFYRSTDGVTWDELDGSRYAKGHPMTSIVWGAATTSACKK